MIGASTSPFFCLAFSGQIENTTHMEAAWVAAKKYCLGPITAYNVQTY